MKNIFGLLALILAMAACQSSASSPQSDIEKLEEQLKKEAVLDSAIATDLCAMYLQYADANPKDSLAPYYLSNSADILKELKGNELKAVNTYNRIAEKYADHPLAGRAVFMIGYVFDDKFNDKVRAQKSYEYFLSQYPKHELQRDALNLLAMVKDSLSAEELVAKWLEQSKKDTNINSK